MRVLKFIPLCVSALLLLARLPHATAQTPGEIVAYAGNGTGSYQGTGDGGPALDATFNHLASVALDKAGDVWVTSANDLIFDAVFEFSPAGQTLNAFGGPQASFGKLSNPTGIAVGPDGRIYVAQPDYGWVTVYTAGGAFYTEFGLRETSPGRFATEVGGEQLVLRMRADRVQRSRRCRGGVGRSWAGRPRCPGRR